MGNYEYGDWYCKPANESEAREIVERAVASGAEIYETVGLSGDDDEYQWDLLDAWGVLEGRTFTGDADCGDSFIYATEYTITEIREIFPLPGEKHTEWNREGLLQVGTICEWKPKSPTKANWKRCTVNYIHGEFFCITNDDSFKEKQVVSNVRFRPLHTKREQWVEQALEHFCDGDGAETMKRIYDAIKSGKLKAPEVE